LPRCCRRSRLQPPIQPERPPQRQKGAAYPTKPIRWVIPFAAGGGTDVVARPIATKLSERLGQAITYDNRGGGGGIIAGEIVAKAAPDGYTMLTAAVAVMTVTPSLTKVPYDPVKDFSPITKFANVPNMLVARAAFPVRTIQEVISHAKANPGKVAWAISGPGSGGHLAMESFRLTTGINVIRVPYKGAGPATVALISNEADLLFANPGVFMPHLKAGRLRAIGAASLKRMALFPDLPTFNESGFPGFESGSWYGLRRSGAHARRHHRVHAQGSRGRAQPARHRCRCWLPRAPRSWATPRRSSPGNTRRHREVGEGDQGCQYFVLTASGTTSRYAIQDLNVQIAPLTSLNAH
jgi:tripartite-type tricarboxylate transporter receptor subunit TctC